ncbi:asparagine synthase (glutamine-hydrolyzing) [Bradyrhizobium sp.]|jgi:asparagine synthase (glutamine-hydrolysing)|uniref:asparagine synthase (glutamine-hydrolyzing) n=1 Tax=Bradyrhizobium sp. TaxID=376 RepID=UPI003C1E0A19
MCGIVAIFSGRERISRPALEMATARLRHRGPDESGYWLAEHGRVGLGHNRLSIIDLETGGQPIGSEDGTVQAIVNGEFYGYESIRGKLEKKGHRFRTRSDSEILPHLYEDHGSDCVKYLRGEFAFVLWDERNQLVFAARDRFGVKPLFYASLAGTVYLASEAKALFAAGVPAHWDYEQYYQHLFLCLNQDRTLFDGVRQVAPGHTLLASVERITTAKYWDLDYAPTGERAVRRSDAYYVDAVRSELEEAVRVRMRSDVPVSCFLSGGVDSSSVLGIAAACCRSPLQAFAASFSDSEYNEGEIARQTAAHAKAAFNDVAIGEKQMADQLAGAVWHSEMLGINAHGVGRYLLSRAVHQAGYKVVLAGDGSDEIFGGYTVTRQDALRYGCGPPPAGGGMDTSLIPEPARTALAAVSRRLGFVPSWIEKLLLNRSIFHALLSPDFAERFSGQDIYSRFVGQFDLPGQLQGRECVVQSLYLWIKSILANYSLACDRLEMAHAVEVRLPFLDHLLFSVVRDIPVELLVRGGAGKHVLREAMQPYLTGSVYGSPKHSFIAPPSTRSADSGLYALIQDTLRGSLMDAVPFFDRSIVVSMLDGLAQMKKDTQLKLDAPLFMMLCTCLLHTQYRL